MSGWTTIEKKKLAIGFREGASLKNLARVLGRTSTGISKALTRFGIRPLGSRPPGVRPGSLPSGRVTCQELKRIFELELGEEERSFFQESADPWASDSGFITSGLEDENETGFLGWVSIETVIAYLKDRGYYVRKCDSQVSLSTGKEKCDYFLNECPYGAEQVLLIANRLRFLQGKGPFRVENITL